jgi:diadenylate cyclase
VTEWLNRIFAGRPWFEILRDVADVLAVAFVIYRALLVVRGTRAMQMGVGLLVILLLYLAAKVFALVTLLNLLGYLLSSIILIVVVVFQNDIRRALIRVGGQAWLGRGRKQEQSRVIDEVVAAVTELARHRIGAIITFEQDANLLEFTKSEGTVIGAAVTRELLVALFYPESVNKLHDGAVLIRDLKIARAGVFFPMPDTKVLDKSLGSRHRAALGITEETDAVVVVVSEERGTISFCFNGNIVPNLDGTALRQTLIGLLGQKGRSPALRLPTPTRASAPRSESMIAKAHKDGPLTTPLPAERPSSPPPRPVAPHRPPLPSVSDHHGHDHRPSHYGEEHRGSEPHETRASVPMKRMPRSTLMPSAHGGKDDKAGEASRRFSADKEHDAPASDRPSALEPKPDSKSFVPKPPETPAETDQHARPSGEEP